MAQPKAQAPFIPGQKEAADLVPDEQESSGRSVAEKIVSVLGSSGTSDGKSNGDDSGGGDGGDEEDEEARGREKQQGDYYAPVETELVPKKADVAHELYSPGAGVDVVTSEHMPSSCTEEQKQPGKTSDAVGSGPGIVETGKGVATEVGDSLGSVRARVTEKLATLHLPSESLGAVKRAIGGAFTSTKDAVQRTQQSLVDILSSSSSSKSSSSVNQVVKDMEKNVLANSEGSGEDMSQVSEGPKLNTAPETTPETVSKTTPESNPETGPKFMRAKL